MSYLSTIINVMIVSPSDVQEERKIVKEIIDRWNIKHAKRSRLFLHPTGWDTHSYPITGGRAQSFINEQVLEDADILVGIFSCKLGTPTGEYESGSVEEIKRHMGEGKPVMLYFSEAPIPREINSNPSAKKQLNALEKFKKEVQEYSLYQSFNNSEEFREKFDRHISMAIDDHFSQGMENERLVRGNHINPLQSASQELSDQKVKVNLSNEAAALLQAASINDPNQGCIITSEYTTGFSVRAGGTSFGTTKSHRQKTLWNEAIDELQKY